MHFLQDITEKIQSEKVRVLDDGKQIKIQAKIIGFLFVVKL